MRFSNEILQLMPAYPGRRFKMQVLLRHATKQRTLTAAERKAAREAMRRLLQSLEDLGQVGVEPAPTRGAAALYFWKPADVAL